MHEQTAEITELILKAAEKARKETSTEPEPEFTRSVRWPVACTVGPGLEGAIACESKIGYVNGAKGWLIYQGYDIFDLCAYSTFEEVCYLLVHGHLPSPSRLEAFKKRLVERRYATKTLRLIMNFPVESMNAMAALRLGTNLMRQEFTYVDREKGKPDVTQVISSDEDSIPMETVPRGEEHAIYEFKSLAGKKVKEDEERLEDASGMESCYHLIAGVATMAAAIARLREGRMPLEPDPELSHAANYLYMMTGQRPTPEQERLMDVALILHADHGMNASTFAALVVASTLSDMYLSVGSAIAALRGPLHGGANEQVLYMLREIGSPDNVDAWFKKAQAQKRRVMGFGHRVYKAYDPRARVLGPLAGHLSRGNKEMWPLYRTARALEKKVVAALGAEKKIFPNVDFYSGLVYGCMGITPDLFIPTFAVSRVAGWTARVMEYLKNNRIFRPRAIYVGSFDKKYVPPPDRDTA
jgi:citrate synthase